MKMGFIICVIKNKKTRVSLKALKVGIKDFFSFYRMNISVF